MFVLFYIIILVTFIHAQPCEDSASIDITKGHKFHDGTIVHNNVTFPGKFIFEKNVTGEIRTYGCLCEVSKCFRKCCELGSVLNLGTKSCVQAPKEDKLLINGLNVYYMNAYQKTVVLNKEFTLFYGWSCRPYIEDANWFVQEDGKLYIEVPNLIPPWMTRPNDKYCIDTFVYEEDDGSKTTKLDALICSKEVEYDYNYTNMLVSCTCMLISCVFILATVSVYLWLPELRNLHGRVLITYLLSLFVGFLVLAIMQALLIANNITPDTCLAMTFFIYYFLLAAFFWMNVMSFDIWWTFSGKRGLSLEKLSTRARFGAYALYAFGVPTALTITMAALEFSGLPAHPLLPNIKQQGCFLYGKSKLLYLYGPMLVLCVANLVFFILTAMKIAQIKEQTSVLKSKESSTHDPHRNDKQRLTLYIKLFIVMGVNWILEVVSALYPEHAYIWRYMDAYNVLIGLIIFIIFVCKRKIFRLMKKRYMQLRGNPMSRTVTASSRTVSSRDDVRMSSIKNNN